MFEYMRVVAAFPPTQGSNATTVEVLVGFSWAAILSDNVNEQNFEIFEVFPRSTVANHQALTKYVLSLGRAKIIQQFFREIPVNMMVDYAEVEFKNPWV